jgi:hypothetical protein
MAGNSTVDAKPAALHLNNARPHARSTPNQQDNAFQAPQAGGYSYPNPYMMLQVPLFYPGQGLPNAGYPYPAYMPTNSTNMAIPTMNLIAKPLTDCPDIIQWFCYLDEHKDQSKDGIQFSQYGILLKNKGFLRISQLMLDFFTLKDLQDWAQH